MIARKFLDQIRDKYLSVVDSGPAIIGIAIFKQLRIDQLLIRNIWTIPDNRDDYQNRIQVEYMGIIFCESNCREIAGHLYGDDCIINDRSSNRYFEVLQDPSIVAMRNATWPILTWRRSEISS